MKRKLLFNLFFVFVLASVGFVSAQQSACDIDVVILNQDPYPAVPGDYVEIVFQAKNIDNPNCGVINFELVEKFPFSLDPGFGNSYTFQGGIYLQDFKTFLIAPYKVRVSEQALEGDNKIKVKYSYGKLLNNSSATKEFNVDIKDLHSDFEISIKDYDKETNNLVLEILNIGEHDVEALTVEIPKQKVIDVKGSSRNIVGNLDSNEDTTFSFEAKPKDGEIMLNIIYTDEINVRRSVEKSVVFESSHFEGRASDSDGGNNTEWIVIVVLLLAGFWWWRRRKARTHHGSGHHNQEY